MSTLAPSQPISVSSPWIVSERFDQLWILSPAFMVTTLACLLAFVAPQYTSLSPLGWLVIVVGVDVAHVYSTLFRTYLSPKQFQRHWRLYTAVPVACLIGLLSLALYSTPLFWTVLAYTAVFHFVRQQVGFFSLYCRHDTSRPVYKVALDTTLSYAVTVYPLIYWHAHLPRAFAWFVPNDFVPGLPIWVDAAARIGYVALWLGYLLTEWHVWKKTNVFNQAKNLLLIGTALSWGVGIIVFNADVPFTLTNVMSHGIPYIALIWGLQQEVNSSDTRPQKHHLPGAFIQFGVIIISLAYFEEALWDGLFWHEHSAFFGPITNALQNTGQFVPATFWPIALSLLALPQLTHYVLDGFIWKRSHTGSLIT